MNYRKSETLDYACILLILYYKTDPKNALQKQLKSLLCKVLFSFITIPV